MTSLNLRQVCPISDRNEHIIEDFAKVLYTLAIDIFYAENVKMIVEYNTYGTTLFQYLRSSLSHRRNDFEDEMILRFRASGMIVRTLKPGIKLKADNKDNLLSELSLSYIKDK